MFTGTLRAWRSIEKQSLPEDGQWYEVKLPSGKAMCVMYDKDWGKGRGGWFNEYHHAVNVSGVTEWRPRF